jgi:hypothetical protein
MARNGSAVAFERAMRFGPLALLTFAQVASAQGGAPAKGPLTLEWKANPSCSSPSQIADEVSRILRGAPGSERPVSARVSLVGDDRTSWHVTIVTQSDGASRERSFEAESCTAAAEAVAVILAIAINPRASPPPAPEVLPPASAAPTSSSTPPPAVATLPPAPPTPPASAALAGPIATPPPAPSALTSTPSSSSGPPNPLTLQGLTVAGSLAIGAGNLPTVGAGAELAVGWRPGRLRLELAGTYWGQQRATASGAGADFELLSTEARAIYAWTAGRLALGPLLAVGLEWIKASGFGGTFANASPAETLGTVGVGGLVTWRLAWRIHLRLALESVFPLSRPDFVVLDRPAAASTVYRPSLAFGRAVVGAEVQF